MRETACGMNYGNPVGWVMGEYFQEVLPGVMGNGDDVVCIEAGVENPLETSRSNIVRGKFGIHQKGKIVKGINEPGAPQLFRAIKIIGVDNIRIS